MPQTLYILVEGPDDDRFIQALVTPVLEGRYDGVHVITWSHMTDKKRRSLVASLEKSGAAYICLTDKDDCPCITSAKDKLTAEWPSLPSKKVVIAAKAIESWYLAGLSEATCQQLKVKRPNDMTKAGHQEFTRSMPKRFDSEIDYRMEILKHYDMTTAKRQSESFAYFCNRLGI